MTENQKLRNVVNYLICEGKIKNIAEFADSIGQNRSGVSDKLTGRRPLTDAFVLRVTSAWPEINPNYFTNDDKAEMLRHSPSISVNGYGNQTAGRDLNVSQPPRLEEPTVPYGDYRQYIADLQGYIDNLNEHIKRLTEIISKLAGGQQL